MRSLAPLSLGIIAWVSSCLLSSCGSETAGTSADPAPASTGEPVFCTQVYTYGIVIHVTDPSGKPINNAQAVIRDESYVETLEPVGAPTNSGIYQGAGERPGTYELTVSAPGYVPQTFKNLVVTKGVCHVDTISREVSLLPY